MSINTVCAKKKSHFRMSPLSQWIREGEREREERRNFLKFLAEWEKPSPWLMQCETIELGAFEAKNTEKFTDIAWWMQLSAECM